VACLVLFALLLTRIDSDFASRAYAAYGIRPGRIWSSAWGSSPWMQMRRAMYGKQRAKSILRHGLERMRSAGITPPPRCGKASVTGLLKRLRTADL